MPIAPTIPININNSIIILDNISQIIYDVNMKDKYYLNICPICDQETHYDQWAKPQVACINCGIEE
jgi:uncharacterized protein with von Willebrand factor type A (vWA) domain